MVTVFDWANISKEVRLLGREERWEAVGGKEGGNEGRKRGR